MDIQLVLAEVNDIRKNRGLLPLTDIPKGIPGDECRCPLALALNAREVHSDKYYIDDNESTPLSDTLKEFVATFDNFGLSEYDITSSPNWCPYCMSESCQRSITNCAGNRFCYTDEDPYCDNCNGTCDIAKL